MRNTIYTLILAFLILSVWISPELMGLDPDKKITQYNVHIWNIEGGLPANSVYAIRQTRDGYLWIGTQAGLARFDGFDFEVYTHREFPQLKCNEIRALYEAKDGTLWIGTNSGGLTRYSAGEFYTFPRSKTAALAQIRTINEDRWGNIWIGSLTEGLTVLSNGRFSTFTTKNGLPHNKVKSIVKDSHDDLWIITAKGIVKLVNPGEFGGKFLAEHLIYDKTASLFKKNSDEVWIGTNENGLFMLKDGKLNDLSKESETTNLLINTIYEDSKGILWIGTDGGGLRRYKEGSFSSLTAGNGLDCGFVTSVYEDKEGSLWVGTLDGGLHQFRDSKFTSITTLEGLSGKYIHCIARGKDGNLWIGTDRGLDRLKNKEVTRVLGEGDGLLNTAISSLWMSNAGDLWIGTWNGLQRFKNRTLTDYTMKQGLSDNRITSITGDGNGNVWIGTRNGLNRFAPSTGHFDVYTTKHGLQDNWIDFIYLDSRGTLWISTQGGLNFIKDGEILPYKLGRSSEKKVVACIYEDHTGALWFGGNNGLVRLKNGDFNFYNEQSGLFDNHVCSIFEDNDGYLWLGGRNGISRIELKELESFKPGINKRIRGESFNELDGMKSRWCSGNGCAVKNETLFFPTSLGLVMFEPAGEKNYERQPTVIIKRVVVDGEEIPVQRIENVPLKLPPGKKRVEFYFTALSFINPGKVRFRTRLAGYEKDWVEMGTARSIIYTGLSPGEYVFHTSARNPNGSWEQPGVSFAFNLLPHFYQTSWFYGLISILLLIMAFWVHRFRVRQLRAREKELGILVEIRTRDLIKRTSELEVAHRNLRNSSEVIEAKNAQLEKQSEQLKEMDKVKTRFFANISHEFRTPITLIMGTLEQIRDAYRDSELKRKVKLMQRNSHRLLNLINQLLDLSKLDSGKMTLHARPVNIIAFLKYIVDSFESLAQQGSLELKYQAAEEEISVYIDSEKIEKVFNNLLINAVKFTPAGGKISVSVKGILPVEKAEPNSPHDSPQPLASKRFPFGAVELSVSDTGIGIGEEQLSKIFNRFYQAGGLGKNEYMGTGIGLALVKELISLHHGQLDVYSSKGKGTVFTVLLPLGSAHLQPEEVDDETLPVPEPGEPPEKFVFFTDEEDSEDTSATKVKNHNKGKNIVLVVEDNSDMRNYIKASLEPLYQVEEAREGNEGIRKAQDTIPDLIISDIMMPEVDGFQLSRQLKNDIRTSHIPIILLTARVSEDDVLEGLDIGVDDYITKPFNSRILLARIKNLIDLRQQLQQHLNREMTLQPTKISVSQLDQDFLKDLQDVIEKHISEPDFNVDFMAKKLYMSASSLYRKVMALTGDSPNGFIRTYRLKLAAKLLKNGFGSVTEVAFEVGFNSRSYFAKCFKDKFHVSPTEYQSSESK
jgi:two-component system, sensor histidine kinase ChiS